MIAIIDYGMGNIHSVQKALESLGAKTMIVKNADSLRGCNKVVLPGVGAFDDAILELKKQNLIAPLKEYIKNKNIFLGICLGMQLLFDESQEAKVTKGLGIVTGGVKKFDLSTGIKVPHMGWNQLTIKQKDCPLFKGVADNAYVYFCHSYYADPVDKTIAAATTVYSVEFPSVIRQENIYAVQFHPEKSQDVGMQILKNFVKL